ncbi:MAG: Uncharacterised protein [Cryomorphaceae bacterium]|nr:MAG: Uncharacterised protein [Cryomorphaceae bacterium]
MSTYMFIPVEVNTVGVDRHFVEHSFKLRQPENGFNPTDVEGLILSVFGAFPYCDQVIGFLQKQNFTQAIFVSIRE